jgi:serine/threonine protein phosphatase 1
MKTFAIADLHGRFDLLQAAYKRIAESSHSGGRIVHLGDYVDRGPQSREIIEFLMDDSTVPQGFERVCLKGNHEGIMTFVCASRALIGWWIDNGGGQTLRSYGAKVGDKADVGIVPEEHLRWLNTLPRYWADEHRVFVHAGVKDDVPLDEHDDETLTWMIYPDGADGGHLGRHVVHGHHQFEDGPKFYKDRTDLDTLAWYTGRLVIGVFDDSKPGGPVSTIEVLGPSVRELRRAA